jgi:hypothetical protein
MFGGGGIFFSGLSTIFWAEVPNKKEKKWRISRKARSKIIKSYTNVEETQCIKMCQSDEGSSKDVRLVLNIQYIHREKKV